MFLFGGKIGRDESHRDELPRRRALPAPSKAARRRTLVMLYQIAPALDRGRFSSVVKQSRCRAEIQAAFAKVATSLEIISNEMNPVPRRRGGEGQKPASRNMMNQPTHMATMARPVR